IEGDIFLAQPSPGSPKIRLFVEGQLGPEVDATRLKFIGVVRPDPNTGQLRTTFENLPPAPFTEFRLTFRGGPTAIMSLPRDCGTYTGQAINTPYGSTTEDRRNGTLPVDQGCADPDPFEPTLGVSTSTTQAASGTALVTTLARPDGHARLTGAKISLPAGLQGNLTVVPPCSVADGRAGTCGPASRVGGVIAIAGPGSSPATLNGDVYFTEPPTPGGLAGLSIVVPAAFGPLDLGKIVVSADVSTRADTGLDITVTDIPQRAEGISTQVRSMQLVLDKPGFFVTPSSCDAKSATATLFSDLGQAAAVSAGFQATGCENLPFAPKLATTVDGGATGKEAELNGHPGLNVTVTQAPGEANNSTVNVTLPSGLAPDSDRLGRTCALKQYEAGTCPDSAKVGRVVAYTPLLPEPLQGAVTFVTVPGSPLPELRADLRGKINLTLNGKITFGADGRMVNSFVGIPDVPLSRFDFTLEGGSRGLVIATKDLCATSALPFDGTFTSHSGASAKATVQPRLDGCAPRGTLKVGSLRRGRPSLDLRVVGGRTRVRSAQLVVPKGLEFQRSAVVKRRVKVSATGPKKGARATVTVTGRSIRVTVPRGQYASVLRVRMSSGGLRVSTRVRRQGRPRLTFALNTTTTADTRTRRQSLRVRPAAR
ncbi:MAG: hypothetical protein JHC84_18155, partial [Solirubrobacteraceae bacterium]|nr:hypothetical protein [Solirubrobacteraceae bacterium]